MLVKGWATAADLSLSSAPGAKEIKHHEHFKPAFSTFYFIGN
jgi:hypothetical protein